MEREQEEIQKQAKEKQDKSPNKRKALKRTVPTTNDKDKGNAKRLSHILKQEIPQDLAMQSKTTRTV